MTKLLQTIVYLHFLSELSTSSLFSQLQNSSPNSWEQWQFPKMILWPHFCGLRLSSRYTFCKLPVDAVTDIHTWYEHSKNLGALRQIAVQLASG